MCVYTVSNNVTPHPSSHEYPRPPRTRWRFFCPLLPISPLWNFSAFLLLSCLSHRRALALCLGLSS